MTDSPIDMLTVEDTVRDWVVNSTGLEAIWAYQSAPRPDYPYGLLNIIAGPTEASPDWHTQTSDNPGGDPGEEIIYAHGVPCQFTVSLTIYVALPDGANPTLDARQYNLRAVAGLRGINQQETFAANSISLLRTRGFGVATEVIGDAYVSVSRMDILFNAVFNVTELGTYIDKVRVKSTEFDVDTLVDAS